MVKKRRSKIVAEEDKENDDSPRMDRCAGTVSFLGDASQLVFIEDVSHLTTKLTGYKPMKSSLATGRSGSRMNRATRSVSIVIPPELEESVSEPSQEDYDVHITRIDDKNSDVEDIEGKSLFGFRTPKRSRMSSKSTPKEKTPKGKEPASSAGGSERKTRRSQRKVEATTPYRLAARMDANNDEAGSEDSVDSDSDQSSVSSTSDAGRPVDRSASQSIPNMADEYFKAQSGKVVTSDHTLARLREDGLLDQSSLQDILRTRPNQYKADLKQLLLEHRSMFRVWMLQLCLGFNLVLYGYGSKKNLIEEFRKTMCSKYNCVVINGFFPSLTLKNILGGIVEDCLGLEEQSLDTETAVTLINQYLNEKDEALYIFVHNIDGPMLRLAAVQAALSSLAALDNVHVISSVDHINAPLMWDQATVTKYRWLWYDATTFEPYLEETSYENSLMTQQSGTLALRSMINVFKSLTPNAKNIFILMAKYHMEHCDVQSYIGIPFQMLYQKCRESFLVNSDQTLRTQLTEFRDHKLIRSRKGIDGAEHIFLPADMATLKDFMEQAEA